MIDLIQKWFGRFRHRVAFARLPFYPVPDISPRQCKHYNGIRNIYCGAGLCYRTIMALHPADAMPCGASTGDLEWRRSICQHYNPRETDP